MNLQAPSASRPTANEELLPLVRSTYKSSCLNFYLNGTKITLTSVDPEATLPDPTRPQRKPKGTKLGCGVGECGAYTVVVQDVSAGGRIERLAIDAFLAPILSGLLFPQISSPGVKTDRVVCVSGGQARSHH